jgi:hypothetical protein
MYLRIKPDNTRTYPYNPNELRRDHPDTSFPQQIPDELAAEYNVFNVQPTQRPEVNRTERVVEVDPVLVDGIWTQQFQVEDKSYEELAQEDQQQADSVRSERSRLLTECDWTQVDDAPVNKQAWANYRQLLREVPDQEGFPWNVTWPTKP